MRDLELRLDRLPRFLAIFLFAACALVSRAVASNTTSTTLALTSSGSAVTSISLGMAVKLTATVASEGVSVSPGTIKFCDTAINASCNQLAVIGVAQLTSSGTATVVVRLGIGSHTLKALFAGTNVYSPSSSATAVLAVTGKYGSATTISSAAGNAPGVYDLTAKVSGLGPLSLASPTGTVQFLNTSNSNAQIATAALASGTTSQSLGFVNPWNSTTSALNGSSAAVGDFNLDGKPDLAVTNLTNNTVEVYLGNGDGTFQPATGYPVGNGALALQAADLNNDGKLDLVLVNETDNTVSVLLGNGDGTFQAQRTIALIGTTGPTSEEYQPNSAATGDFNGDGTLDLIVTYGYVPTDTSGADCVLLGNGDGTFQAPACFSLNQLVFSLSISSVAVGDFNGDGKLDVVTAGSSYEDVFTISIQLGNGDGTLQPAQYPANGEINQPASAVVVGDFNGDGKLDMALSNVSDGFTAPGQSSVSILLGNGDGTFQTPVTYEMPINVNPLSILVADFNGDGNADLAVPSANGFQLSGILENGPPLDPVYIFFGNGDGTFQTQQGYSAVSSVTGTASALATGDFNGDGNPDLMFLGVISDTATFASTALLNSGSSTTVTATGVAIAGGSPQLVDAAYSGDSVYGPSTSDAISLSPIAGASLTWANPAPISYGTPLGATQLDATSTVAGTFAYSPPAGTVLSAGSQSLSVTFTPKDTADYTPVTQVVTLVVNPIPLTISANNAARVYGAANPSFTGNVTGAVNGDTFTENFTTTATASSTVGSYPIVPAISGAQVANYTVSATNGTLTITQAGTTTSFALSNQDLALTAIVASLTTGVPTGTVSFYGGQALIGTGTLSNGVATYTPAMIPSANIPITADYSGDANFTQSSSPAVSVLAVAPAVTSLTVAQTASVTDTLTVTAAPGYTATLQLSCSGLPMETSCNFQPSSVSLTGTNSPSTVLLTIQTGASATAALRRSKTPSHSNWPLLPAMVVGIPGLFSAARLLRFSGRANRAQNFLLFTFLLVGFGTLLACGGGSNTSNGTPTGTSIVQVLISGGSSISQTVSLTLTVQ